MPFGLKCGPVDMHPLVVSRSSGKSDGGEKSVAGSTRVRVRVGKMNERDGEGIASRVFVPELVDVETVEAFGDDYFALLRSEPELARCFAFSSRILVVLGDRVLEVR